MRDFVIDYHKQGGESKNNYIFVQSKVNEKGKLLGRKSLAQEIAKLVGKEKQAKKDMKSIMCEHCFDVRTFGIVYSVSGQKFNLTGPVQFGWAHSMHPVETQYVQGTVVIPSKDATDKQDGQDEQGATQGTIWTSYTVPFAVFAMPGIINAKNADHSGMTNEDQELLLQALWQGTIHRQARGRGQQQPLILVHIEYKNPFYRIGYLEDLVSIKPDNNEWRQASVRPSSLKDVSLDLTQLLTVINKQADRIERCRIWCHPAVNLIGDISSFKQNLW